MKNPFDRFSPRTIRAIFTVCALVVLSVCLVNFFDLMVFKALSNDQCGWLNRQKGEPGVLITHVVTGGVTDKAGIRNGDILLSINGIKVNNTAHGMSIINPLPPGTYVTYTIERNGVRFDTQVEILKAINVQFLALFILGVSFLVVGYVVVMTKPQGSVQRLFGWYGIVAMLVFGLFNLNLDPGVDAPWKVGLLGIGFVAGRMLSVPTFLLFFLNFPLRYTIARTRWLVVLLVVVGVAAALPFAPFFAGTIPAPLRLISVLLPLALFFIGLGIFALSYFRVVERNARKQLRPILIGSIIGIASYLYVVVASVSNPFLLFTNPMLLAPGLLIVTVPVSFGYAIFRYRLMDIDVIVKRSLLYGAITAVIAAMYILTVYGLGNLVANWLGTEENTLMNIIALVVIAFAIDPIKQKVQTWIERYFYQERYNYQTALSEFSQELPRLINLDQILTSMVNRISSTMHIEKVAVVIWDEDGGSFNCSQGIDEACCQFDELEGGLLSVLRNTKVPHSFLPLADDPDSLMVHEVDREKIVRAGVVLSVPMFLKGRLIGLINVGPKMSGKVYSKEDMELLTTVGSQAAIAIENARLRASEIKKQKIEEELSLARKIQQGLLPKSNPVIAGLEVAGISVPAHSVGGDYFDFIQLSPSRLLVVVADVSGKGMSAALYMSKVQGMVQLAAHMYSSPKEILLHVNRRIFDSIERKAFITMILAWFDVEKREVAICRAGHTKALIVDNGHLKYLDAGGIGLGLERGPVFESKLEEVRLPLNPNGVYIFYTDGISETMNELRMEFGEDRLLQLVQSKRNLSAMELQHELIRATEEFRGSGVQHDDLALVIVKSA